MSRKIWIAIIILGLLAAACNGSAQETGPVAETPEGKASQPAVASQTILEPTTNPSSKEHQAPTEEPTQKPTFAILHGPGDVNLTEPASGLEMLPSYQAVLKLAFDGTKDGGLYKVSKTYTLTVQRDPAARLLVEESAGPEGANVYRLFANIAGIVYRQEAADGPCQASLVDADGTGSLFEPARLLPHLQGAEQTGEQVVEGVTVQGLQFDNRALGVEGEAEGTAAIAKDGGYLVSYSLRLKTWGAVFGAGMQGQQTWAYTLTQPGPEAFQLPDACPQDTVEMATLPEAENVLRLPGYLRYTISQDAGSVSAFYTDQLIKGGWQLAGDPVDTGGGTRWLFLRLVEDKEQTALLTTRPYEAGLEVTLVVLP